MTKRSQDRDVVVIIAIVVVVIAVLIASAHPLPGLRDIAAVLPALIDLVTDTAGGVLDQRAFQSLRCQGWHG